MKVYIGKTIEDLLQRVAIEKKEKKEDLFYDIISQNKGFLGFGKKVEATIYSKNDIQNFIKEYLIKYFENIELNATVDVKREKEKFKAFINSENNAILIGKNGYTLNAITNVVTSATSSKFKKRILVVVDINGYKEEKYEKLCHLASKIGKEVQKSKIDVVLDPMPSDERKIIHQYISKMKNIDTKSEGKGNNRRIKIIYVKNKKG